ncbi:hypothetical protein GA0074694_5140 [Micromonospora inyonensis]|uniref:Uncharacterized protein n=1 Tax=Micromonospora inyonensis TaxID=47866 RepID=A0A1C6SGI3_9ACTN|nr:hypothetical protein GA0074694_5140 [Micromonospora inyonensis]
MPDLVRREWQRTSSGLYVPKRDDGPGDCSPYEQEDLKYTRRQTLAALAGAVLSLLALIGSGAALVYTAKAWDGQQTLVEQQIALNRVNQERERRVYSSRVALWATIGTDFSSVKPAGVDVHVQNRSPVPLRRVRLLVPLESGRVAEARIADVPPCVVRTMRVAPPVGERFADAREQWLGYTPVVLEFEETGRFWRLGDGGLTLTGADVPAYADRLRLAAPTESPVGDCGEGA